MKKLILIVIGMMFMVSCGPAIDNMRGGLAKIETPTFLKSQSQKNEEIRVAREEASAVKYQRRRDNQKAKYQWDQSQAKSFYEAEEEAQRAKEQREEEAARVAEIARLKELDNADPNGPSAQIKSFPQTRLPAQIIDWLENKGDILGAARHWTGTIYITWIDENKDGICDQSIIWVYMEGMFLPMSNNFHCEESIKTYKSDLDMAFNIISKD